MKLWFCLVFPLLMLHFNQQNIIKGRMLNSESKKPVADAFVVVVAGEEEAVSNSNGYFEIRTSQQYPITVTIIHKAFKEKT